MTVPAPQLEGFVERMIEADGFKIRYWESGSDAAVPPLVVIHGAGGPQGNAGGALELLAKHHRVIAFELPGFGRSEPNTRTANGREMAATLASAMDALEIDRYAVSGTSMGGIVALWWAADFPKNVVSVVLEVPSAFRCCYTRPSNLMADREVFIRAFHGRPERKPWLADFKPAVPPNWDLVTRIMGADRDEALTAKLPTIEAPVLALMGTKDGIISADEGRHYKELIQNCYLMMVYGAAHDLKGDRPEAFAEVVGDFLAHGPKFLVRHQSTMINP
jgi:pimeloyl-ACP methyl ester carboxylesterase